MRKFPGINHNDSKCDLSNDHLICGEVIQILKWRWIIKKRFPNPNFRFISLGRRSKLDSDLKKKNLE